MNSTCKHATTMVVGIKNGSTNTDTDCKEFRTKFRIKALCLEIGCSQCTSFDREAGECVYFTNPLLAQISTYVMKSFAGEMVTDRWTLYTCPQSVSLWRRKQGHKEAWVTQSKMTTL